MDIILFNPAPRSGWQAHRRVELPLSLLCPATPLDREGYKVRIIDGFANPDWKPELLRALEHKPICFGVTCMTGPQILYALEGCKIVRERYPDVPIVWGGVHASLMPEQTLENPCVDIVVIGEGEVTFPELVKALENNTPLSAVAGIGYKENGKFHLTGDRPFVDLNKQPPLSYHLLDINLYRRKLFGVDHLSLNSSRGCTLGCSFCWDPVIHKRKWRAMQPDNVLEHMKRIVRDYGIRGFLFTDDNFFLDMQRAYRILEGIVRSGLDISFGKLHIRADAINKLDRDFLELLVRAKVNRLTVGVESGSQRILELIKKKLTVEQVIAANRKLIPYPIVPVYLFMMGLPTETPDDFAKSIKLAVRLTDENPRAVKSFNIYTPYPGTELYEFTRQYGLKEPGSLREWAKFNYRNIPTEAAWILPELKKLIEGLDFPLMFLGKGSFVTPFKSTNPIVVGLAKLYYPLAHYRVTHMKTQFPIETKIIKALGFFGKQG